MRPSVARPTAACLLASALSVCAQVKPPTTRKDNVREVFHGVAIVDPYHWLEDQSSAATRAWIDRENAYAHALLDPQPVRAAISQGLTEMLRHDQVGGPELRG